MITIKKILIIILFTILVFLNRNDVFLSVLDGVNLWLNNIFPSLFPFFMISQFLINYNFVYYISKLLKPFMKLIRCNYNISYIFVLSLITGFPASAKYTKELLNNNLINEYDASKALTFTHFANPLFVLGIVGLINTELSYIVLISHYLPNIIIAFIYRNYHPSTNKMCNYKIEPKKLSLLFKDSINDSMNTLLLILGTIVTFKIISIVISNTFNISLINNSILSGILEITQGIKSIALLSISNKIKGTLITFLLSFGGLSVHLQVLSIISDTNIKYKPFLISRIIHSILSVIIFLIIS